MGYIKAMRLPACIFAGLFTFLGFSITSDNLTPAYLPSIVTFLIATATMVQNDWRDRFNDTKKGKDFAFDHPDFKIFVIVFWTLAIVASISLIFLNPWYLILTTTMITSGLIYSETRLLPFIPNTIVAMTVAAATLYPVFDGFGANPVLWIFFTTIFLIIYAREILKDFDDKEIDPGYKWSLLEKYGQEQAKIIAVMIILFTSRLVEILTIGLLCLPGRMLKEPAITLLIEDPTPETINQAKFMIDICQLTIVLIFLAR